MRSRSYDNCHQEDSGEVVEEGLVVQRISSLQYDPEIGSQTFVRLRETGTDQINENNLRR